jgi:hypothetical protein
MDDVHCIVILCLSSVKAECDCLFLLIAYSSRAQLKKFPINDKTPIVLDMSVNHRKCLSFFLINIQLYDGDNQIHSIKVMKNKISYSRQRCETKIRILKKK